MNDAPQFSATYTPSTGLTPDEFAYVDDGQPDKNVRYSVAYDNHAFDLLSPSAIIDEPQTPRTYHEQARRPGDAPQSSHTSGGSSSDTSTKQPQGQIGGPSQSSLHLNKVDSAYGSNLDQSVSSLRLFKSPSRSGLNRVSSQPPKSGRNIYQKMTMAPRLKTSESMPNGDDTYESDDRVGRSLSTSQPRSKRSSTENGATMRPGRMSISLRKGNRLTGMMSNVFGGSRKISISEPQTIVHLIHVGVDSETGEYTVGIPQFSGKSTY